MRNVNELHERILSRQDRLADAITSFAGSMPCVYVHTIWFGLWVLINGLNFFFKAFDPFPFGLLTMVVSLEAIYLNTFVMIGQNRQAQKDRIRADEDYQINLKAEQEVAKAVDILQVVEVKLDAYLSVGYDCLCKHPFWSNRGIKCSEHRD